MDVESLCTLGFVDRFALGVSLDNRLWKSRLDLPWFEPEFIDADLRVIIDAEVLDGASRHQHTKAFFFAQYRNLRRWRANFMRVGNKILLSRRFHNFATFGLIQMITATPYVILALLAVQMLLGFQSSLLTFAPVQLFGAAIVFDACLLAVTRWWPNNGVLAPSHYSDSRSIVKLHMLILGQGNTFAAYLSRASFSIMAFLLFAFLLVFSLQVDGFISWHWTSVLSPLLLAAAMWSCAPRLGWMRVPAGVLIPAWSWFDRVSVLSLVLGVFGVLTYQLRVGLIPGHGRLLLPFIAIELLGVVVFHAFEQYQLGVAGTVFFHPGLAIRCSQSVVVHLAFNLVFCQVGTFLVALLL